MVQAGFSQRQAAVDVPHTTQMAVDANQPANQEEFSSKSRWQLLEGALDANQYRYQQLHDMIPTSRSAEDQTTDQSAKGSDSYMDESLSSDQGYV